jgi:hypothetical protein
MIEADPRVSTPPLNSSASNIIDLIARRASRPAVLLPPENVAEVKRLPYDVTRRAHSRKPRRSKNGTPDERAGRQTEAAPQVQAPAWTETHQNLKARERRNDAWQAARAATDYWKARMRMHDAIYVVQDRGLPEGRLDPEHDHDERMHLVAYYRAAIARQFLTPAPRLDAVEWKRKKLAAGEHKYTGLKPERIEFAIAQDLEFLALHPTRRQRSPQQ